MMRIYQGVDIISISRFRDVVTRHGRFIEDVFTPRERDQCLSRRDPYPHLAGRFAAKEACLKALGRGLTAAGVDHVLQEIEIERRASGQPRLTLGGWAQRLGRNKLIQQCTVSISHSADYAVATVILLGAAQQR
jgi:holo-[acyl-carrier protein] synthase